MFVSTRSRPAARRGTLQPRFRADDATILSLLIARQPRAIELAYDNWAAPLLTVALRITHDAEAAEQRVMGAYMALWRSPDVDAIRRESLLAYLFHLVVIGSRPTA